MHDRDLHYPSVQSSRTHARNTHRVVIQWLALRAVRELGSTLGELGETADGQVLFVRVACSKEFFGLPDTGQHVRLAVAVTVCTDTKIDLAGILVSLECLGNTCDNLV